ncbi:MAG: hypothetical protein Q7N50_03775 [Armatimonadota bacterium]|nr:hypothetical protein [Armatimonadota bacterium]
MNIEELESFSPHTDWYDVRDQLARFIYARSDEAFDEGDAARDAIATVDQLEERQSYMRGKFIEAIGGIPSSGSPLNAKTVGTIHCVGFKIEKVIFD